MNEQDYITAVQTLVTPKLSPLQRLDNFALGLVGESAELYEKLSNPVSYMSPDKPYLEVLIDELGDCNWYFTNACVDLDIVFCRSSVSKLHPEDAIIKMLVHAGKFCDIIKKMVYHEHPVEKHSREIVEHLWAFKKSYLAFLNHYEISESEVRQYNFDKLSKRYPDLKFSSERSINREQ